MIDPEAQIDNQTDHIVDTQGVSYFDARQQLGVAQPDNTDFTSQAIQDRLGVVEVSDNDLMPDEETSQKGGLNHSAWGESFKDPKQAAINKLGIEACRAALRNAREQ